MRPPSSAASRRGNATCPRTCPSRSLPWHSSTPCWRRRHDRPRHRRPCLARHADGATPAQRPPPLAGGRRARPPRPHGAPRHGRALAERADQEGWPAARFLAALAEIELAERDTRRIRRHLLEANLPTGKTLATFDAKVIPSIPRAHIEALAAGDWLETGANLIAIGNSGAG